MWSRRNIKVLGFPGKVDGDAFWRRREKGLLSSSATDATFEGMSKFSFPLTMSTCASDLQNFASLASTYLAATLAFQRSNTR
jgi:hypothetical protein